MTKIKPLSLRYVKNPRGMMWERENPPPTNTEVLHDTIIKEGPVGLASLDYVRSPTRKMVLLSTLTSSLQPIQEHYIIFLSIYIYLHLGQTIDLENVPSHR